MHILFDSVDLSQIPASAGAVAGYIGGAWPTDSHDALRGKFPNAYVLSIATQADQDASVLDVEQGDAVIGDAAPWLERQLHNGKNRPCIYGSQSTMTELEPYLRGIPRQYYRLWVAAPNGLAFAERILTQGFGACQFDWHYLGRDLDASLCKPGFFTAAEYPLALAKVEAPRVAPIDAAAAQAATITGTDAQPH